MRIKNIFSKYFSCKRVIFLLLLFSFSNGFAQNNKNSGSHNPNDSLFKIAKQFAYSNQRDLARNYCNKILSSDTTYYDASVLMARTFSWDKQYDSAKTILTNILNIKFGYYDAIDAMIDLQLWSNDYTQALKYSNIALSFHPKNENFLFKKAKALNYLGNTNDASEILVNMLDVNPSNKEASDLLFTIKSNKRINKAGISYDVEAFESNIPWHFENIQLSRKTKKFGSVTLRYNMAQRFDKSGNQFELDAYPSLRKGTYLYANAGYSSTELFPKTRLSLEVYQKLPKSFEFSLGFRYMNFDNSKWFPIDSTATMIYTGTIGKYYGNYWFSLRPYLNPRDNKMSKSFNLTVRRYFSDSDHYLSLTLGTGFSPDDHQFAFSNPTNYFLKSQKISITYQFKLFNYFITSVNTGIAQEEYYPGKYRNRFSTGLQIIYIF